MKGLTGGLEGISRGHVEGILVSLKNGDEGKKFSAPGGFDNVVNG